jgi:archaellum component FlaC
MTDNENSRFKIRLDDETPDTGFQEELEDQRIEKSSRRITLVSILIPCLLCVILFVAYIDIKKRVAGIHNTGETLSQDLDARISDLSAKHAKLNESINKTTSSMQKELNETTTAIKYIRSARRSDNKKFNGLTDTIEKKLESACKDLEITASKIKILDSGFKKELVDISKGLDKAKKELNKLQTDIATLSSAKIDKKMLDLALKKEQKIYQQKLDKTAKGLENKIKSIQKSLKQVKAEIVPPKPGNIIEQNLEE